MVLPSRPQEPHGSYQLVSEPIDLSELLASTAASTTTGRKLAELKKKLIELLCAVLDLRENADGVIFFSSATFLISAMAPTSATAGEAATPLPPIPDTATAVDGDVAVLHSPILDTTAGDLPMYLSLVHNTAEDVVNSLLPNNATEISLYHDSAWRIPAVASLNIFLALSISQFSSLKIISCTTSGLDDDDLLAVADCFSYLQRLELYHSVYVVEVFQISVKLRSLFSLDVSDNVLIAKRPIAHLVSDCASLRELKVRYCSYFGDFSIEIALLEAAKIAFLSTLELSNVFFVNLSLQQLSELKTKLEKLVFLFTGMFTNVAFLFSAGDICHSVHLQYVVFLSHLMVGDIATLIEILNTETSKLISSIDELSSGVAMVPRDEFINSKLIPKLARQIQDVLALCSGSFPAWCYQLIKSCPFHFSFETRRQFLNSSAFGLSHALHRLGQQQGLENQASVGDRKVRVGILQRQKVRVLPNLVTFVCSLSAYNRAGVVDEGIRVFDSMRETHGIMPGPEHYVCVVNLLGQVGRVDQAYQIIMIMSVPVCAPLLNAYRVYKKSELGKIATKKLFEFDLQDSGNHVFLSYIIAATGWWKESTNIRNEFNEVASNSMISGYLGGSDEVFTFDVLLGMNEVGVKPNACMFLGLLVCCSTLVEVEVGMQVHRHGGRALRQQKIIMNCPCYPTDISNFLQNSHSEREGEADWP